ncbi:hypothetical protein OG279_26230 [Streptomyces sp. NBC_01201]|uniref:hypothetical protein n=1 Tax=unclassified Streptomyces TaxID=2593676 RepID=UPI002E0FE043|nr:hypothetical protein OG725_24480 [Streptomyces sp. NBC_01213]WSQ82785.1 hypothetical protein OG725_37425 [Streptomyces sp. NBC_01213]WSR50918.1 hypothetical protein OG279_26230 [Streptomyces sp. NBC_01201]
MSTTVQLPPVPTTIPRDTLRDICRTLGLDPGDVREIRLGLNELVATLYLSDADGHKIRYGDGPATVVVTIPIG